jgi:predicted O-linked N-acetylglucosamine transferase (SPINDLY family)
MPSTYYPTYNERLISNNGINRLEIGIPEDAFVLCCFNQSYKISSEEFSIWMKIMRENKNTYLILLIRENATRDNLLKELKKNNIDKKRLIFFDYIDITDHLLRHNLADLYLDTFYYNGHTSAVDSLFSGLPVVTKKGKSFSARVCASLLNAFGMPELVTNSTKEYYNLITKLISDKIFYNYVLNNTKKNVLTSNLFDTKKYVKDFEKGLLKAFKYKKEKKFVKNIEI